MRDLIAAGAAIVLAAGTANAAQITLGASAPAVPWAISGDGLGGLTGVVAPYTETALFDAEDIGTASFGGFSFTAGPQTAGVFALTSGGASVFGYSAPDGDAMSGTVQWATINDGSANPHMFGELTVDAISGDPHFVGSFGAVDAIDFIFQSVATVLDDLAMTTWSIDAGPSGGEILGPVSEPGSLALLAVGVAVLGAWWYAAGRVRIV